MQEKIKWETMMGVAMRRAQSENKPIMLEFFHPDCIGCRQMGKITFADDETIEFINENTIPLRIQSDTQPLASDYNIHWTPTILLLDSDGIEHHRIVGFLEPDEFIPALMLGMDKMYFDADQLDDAIENLHKLITYYPKSISAPEAIYLQGVSLFKSTHDAQQLKDAHERLVHDYPNSEWTMRSGPYELL